MKGWQEFTDVWLHRLTIPVILAVTAYMAIAVDTPHTTIDEDAGFAEVMFNNRAVVKAAWIIAVDGAIFLLASLLARSAAKQWARQAGPVQAGPDPAKDPEAEVRDLTESYQGDARAARDEIDRLRERLRQTDELHRSAVADLAARERELGECRSRLRRLEGD